MFIGSRIILTGRPDESATVNDLLLLSRLGEIRCGGQKEARERYGKSASVSVYFRLFFFSFLLFKFVYASLPYPLFDYLYYLYFLLPYLYPHIQFTLSLSLSFSLSVPLSLSLILSFIFSRSLLPCHKNHLRNIYQL